MELETELKRVSNGGNGGGGGGGVSSSRLVLSVQFSRRSPPAPPFGMKVESLLMTEHPDLLRGTVYISPVFAS